MSSLDIESLLKYLRTPAMRTKPLFESYIPDAWELFKFTGEPDLASFEGFLIETVSRVFTDAEHDIDKAKKRDACLVGLGLLNGCYHTEVVHGIPAHCDVQERYINYLRGDYIRLSYPEPTEGDSLDITNSKSRPRAALDQSERRARKELSEHLNFIVKNDGLCQKYLDEGIQKYTASATITDKEGEREVRQIILPQPCYTLKNFPLTSTQPQQSSELDPQPTNTQDSSINPSTTEQNDIQDNDTREANVRSGETNEPDNIPLQLRILVYSMLLIASVVVCITCIWMILRTENPAETSEVAVESGVPITDIHICNDDIHLKPGENEMLHVDPCPSDADKSLLQYQSEKTEVAYVKSWGNNWFVIASQQKWQDDACHETDIKVQANTITKIIHVTIEKPVTVSTIVSPLGEGPNKNDDGDGSVSVP